MIHFIKLFTFSLLLFPIVTQATGSYDSIQSAHQQFLEAQKSKSTEAYWASLEKLADALFAAGKHSSAYQLMNLVADHRTSASSRLILAQDRQVKAIALYSLLPVLISFSFFIFVFYRNRRELLFRQRQAEVEMKALRAQMNPHFIFNCMNSIYKFLNENDSKMGGDYLLRFSKLIRAVLENSNHKEVTLEDDLLALELYIQMEQLRLQHKFDYIIAIDPTIDQEATFIPPLILQPFVENAIWHGLNNRSAKGLLEIKIKRMADQIRYSIVDNGRPDPEVPRSGVLPVEGLSEKIKKTSMGSGLTKDRIDLLNRSKGAKARISETILTEAGGNYSGRQIDVYLPFISG